MTSSVLEVAIATSSFRSIEHENGRPRRLPSKLTSCARPDSRGRLSPRATDNLRGFAWSLGFQSLLTTNVDFDLLGLGFRLFRQSDLQDSLVIVGRDLLRIHSCRQSEGPGEASILPLHATVILFFLFLFELAFAVHSQSVVLDANIDVLLVNARDFDFQRDVVFVFVHIHGRRKRARGQRLVLRVASYRITEQPVHAILQSVELTERIPTG